MEMGRGGNDKCKGQEAKCGGAVGRVCELIAMNKEYHVRYVDR